MQGVRGGGGDPTRVCECLRVCGIPPRRLLPYVGEKRREGVKRIHPLAFRVRVSERSPHTITPAPAASLTTAHPFPHILLPRPPHSARPLPARPLLSPTTHTHTPTARTRALACRRSRRGY